MGQALPQYYICQLGDLVAQMRLVRSRMVLVKNTDHLQYAAINLAIAEDDFIRAAGEDMDRPWQIPEYLRHAVTSRVETMILRSMQGILKDVDKVIHDLRVYDADLISEDVCQAHRALHEAMTHIGLEIQIQRGEQ